MESIKKEKRKKKRQQNQPLQKRASRPNDFVWGRYKTAKEIGCGGKIPKNQKRQKMKRAKRKNH